MKLENERGSGMSLMYRAKKREPRTLLWGIPMIRGNAVSRTSVAAFFSYSPVTTIQITEETLNDIV